MAPTALQILVTATFAKAIKKLHPPEKKLVDDVVAQLAQEPYLGEEKKGDLAGIFVYKFKINKQEVLLAYRLEPYKITPQRLVLLNLGSHENFYTKLKRQDL
jgi:mRNA-degrading endonuclease RelE of RelBE toxin-antitoxin system